MGIFNHEIFHVLALLFSIVFTTIAAVVPPNAGNFVGGLFVATLASFAGGEEEPDVHEEELEDADI